MIVLAPEEMQEIDQLAVNKGFPELLLMEEAGRSTADLICEVQRKKNMKPRALIFCHTGNNGGDGLVVARYLDMWNFDIKVILTGTPDKFSEVTQTNYELCKMRNINLFTFSDMKYAEIKNLIKEREFIVDALLGTGIKGEVRGAVAEVIDLIEKNRSSSSLVFSLDIPSGISGRTGEVLGGALQADYTAVMAFPKIGLCLYPGVEYAGKQKIIDIGLPGSVTNQVTVRTFSISDREAGNLIPDRPAEGYKGTFGRVGVIGGSPGMVGAPCLTGLAALKVGSGLVKLGIPESIQATAAGYRPELLTEGLSDDSQGISRKALPRIKKIEKDYDVLAVGPGLGRSSEVNYIVETLIKEAEIPLILDADALNELSAPELLLTRDNPTILTPHPGEMANLLDINISSVSSRRIPLTREFASEHGVYLVLKGAATTVGHPNGDLYINPTGTQGLATAGSGDVLTGIIAGLVAQGADCGDAAVLGPYLHGMAGELGSKEQSAPGLTAGDIIDFIPDVLKKLL